MIHRMIPELMAEHPHAAWAYINKHFSSGLLQN